MCEWLQQVLPERLGVIGAGPIGLEMAQVRARHADYCAAHALPLITNVSGWFGSVQAFQRLGSKVTVFLRGQQVLSKEDPDAAAIIEAQLVKDGVTFVKGVTYVGVAEEKLAESEDADAAGATAGATAGAGAGAGAGEGAMTDTPRWGVGQHDHHGAITVTVEVEGKEQAVVVDQLFVAAGRVPNVDVGLDAAGIEFDTRRGTCKPSGWARRSCMFHTDAALPGVHVNDKLQTTNSNVYAVGDCCSQFQFTHVADFMARIVTRNALFFGRSKFSALIIPWATYTEPEVAHVGLYESDLQERGIKFTTFEKSLEHIDRCILDGETDGFLKVHVRQGSDEILGATIVSSHAGDIISELTLAMQTKTGTLLRTPAVNGLDLTWHRWHSAGLGAIGSVIHPYPTQADVVRLNAGNYNRTRLTPTVKAIFNRLMSVRR